MLKFEHEWVEPNDRSLTVNETEFTILNPFNKWYSCGGKYVGKTKDLKIAFEKGFSNGVELKDDCIESKSNYRSIVVWGFQDDNKGEDTWFFINKEEFEILSEYLKGVDKHG